MQRSQIFVQNRVFAYPTCIRRPRYGGSRRNIATPFDIEKLEWLGYSMVKKVRFNATHERDTHTHGQTPHDSMHSIARQLATDL